MNHRLLAVVLLLIVFGTLSHAQEPAADSVPATVPGNSGGGLATELGFGGSGFGGEDEFGHALGLPASAIPGRKWVAGAKVIVALSDDGKQVFAYSEQHPRWTPQDLEPMEGTVAVPVVGEDVATVRHGHFCYAYSTKLGTWDVLKLPKGEVAIPQVGTNSVTVHSASQGDLVYKNAWGKWFSTEEIKAGQVAKHLLESSRSGANGDSTRIPQDSQSKPHVIIIESSPEMERSEVILKIVKALEKEGIAKVVPMNEANSRPVDFNARILVSPDLQSDSIQIETVVRTLRLHGVQRVTFGSAKPDANNAVFVNCLPNVTWREVRSLQSALSNFKEFQVDVRVAQNDGPVTSTLTPRFTGEPKLPESHKAVDPGDSTLPSADSDQETTKSIRLKYAPASDAARIVEQLLESTRWRLFSLAVDGRINAIHVRGNKVVVKEVVDLLELLDVAEPQSKVSETDLPKQDLSKPQSSNAADVTSEFLKQAIADFRQRVEDLDRQSRGLADQLKQSRKNPAEAEKLHVLLRDVVQKVFTTRQELRHAELELFAIRLRDLKQSVELRKRISDKIVDRRIKELLDPNLSWETSDD